MIVNKYWPFVQNHFEKLEVAKELPLIEAQTLQHDEQFKIMQVKNDDLKKIVESGDKLEDHKEDVAEKVLELNEKSEKLDNKWAEVKKELEEAIELARFERDCQRIEHWMEVRQTGMNLNNY